MIEEPLGDVRVTFLPPHHPRPYRPHSLLRHLLHQLLPTVLLQEGLHLGYKSSFVRNEVLYMKESQ